MLFTKKSGLYLTYVAVLLIFIVVLLNWNWKEIVLVLFFLGVLNEAGKLQSKVEELVERVEELEEQVEELKVVVDPSSDDTDDLIYLKNK